jgi:hypothetical protein
MAKGYWKVTYYAGQEMPFESREDSRGAQFFNTAEGAQSFFRSMEDWEEPRLEYMPPLEEDDIPF